MIRALLVIDVHFYREGLASLLAQSADISVVATLSSGDKVIETIERAAPNVVLLDTSSAHARELLVSVRRLGAPPPVVALALNETAESIEEWAGGGALGYVSRSASLADLLQCLRSAVRGEAYCSPRVMAILLSRFATLKAEPRNSFTRNVDLTAREREILELVGSGLSNKLIAVRLHISHATAKNHVHNILDKLRLRNRTEVAAYLHRPETSAPALHASPAKP
jgi:two-component system, NarL family, nitrate/nitrite response regulator NarL